MRITFLLTQSLESPSGLGRYWPLAKEMVRLGHQVTILALHHDFRRLAQPVHARDGVEVRYVAQMHVLKQGNTKSYFRPARFVWIALCATWQLTRYALTTPADLYHLGKPHPMNGIAGWVAARFGRVPLYVDCDDYEVESNRYAGRWQRAIVRWFEDWLPQQTAGVTVNTRFTEARLQGLGVPRDKIVYVPNGADTSRFPVETKATAAELRQKLNINDRPVAMYVGSLSLASHPVDLLIDAFAIVHEQLPQAVLLLVGGGDSIETLQAQVAQRSLQSAVRFVGRVPPEQVADYLRLATVSVDPVNDDPVAHARSPLKLIESMMVATPVITGDVGDRKWVLESGKAGVLVEPNSAAALAQAITSVLETPTRAQQLSQAGRQRAEAFRWDHLVHDFVRVYET